VADWGGYGRFVPPLVGITSSPALRRSPILEVDRSLTTLDRAYVDAVTTAEGVPVILPVQSPGGAEAVVERLDALILSGGGDVAPERYGATRHPAVGGVDEARDAWEVALIAQARQRSLPVLAICRGMQILNVALGGTLIQHLPDHDDGHPHLVPGSFDAASHHVEITPGSTMAKVLDTDAIDVNSLHHQAIDRCADDLVVVGIEEHGIIEAVEHPDEPILGVQWHPELIAHLEPHHRLFTWLVQQAGGDDHRSAR
jgi:gamma-glutamyl-gamma-aminobutyrate hydrolase PuuD